jgi:putative endonuclease
MSRNSQLGKFGEDLAVQALEFYGYAVHDRNWRCRLGEIDIIAQEGEVWVVVEVKLRTNERFGTPEEAVDVFKQNRLLQLGQAYAAERDLLDQVWRIDVVAILLSRSNKVERLQIIRDAVQGNG